VKKSTLVVVAQNLYNAGGKLVATETLNDCTVPQLWMLIENLSAILASKPKEYTGGMPRPRTLVVTGRKSAEKVGYERYDYREDKRIPYTGWRWKSEDKVALIKAVRRLVEGTAICNETAPGAVPWLSLGVAKQMCEGDLPLHFEVNPKIKAAAFGEAEDFLSLMTDTTWHWE
jgi:hypothetical protein